jgi:hypothetical protein
MRTIYMSIPEIRAVSRGVSARILVGLAPES